MKAVYVSIAMCTYNGAPYVQQQLESFARQSRRPDELIICDDGSTDATVSILHSFRRRAPFEISIRQNPEWLGYIRNFESAVARCSGDVIFLSDQDDMWFDEKIERHLGIFSRDPECLVVINDAEIVDDTLTTTGLTKMRQTRSLGSSHKNFVTGCCTSFRGSLWDMVSPIPADVFTHDAWINHIAHVMDRRVVLEEVLQYIRRHSANASDGLSSRLKRVHVFHRLYRTLRNNPLRGYFMRARRVECMERRFKEQSDTLCKLLGNAEQLEAVLQNVRAERSWYLKPYYAARSLRGGRRGHP